MPSIRYMNQSAPFWDFIANLENQGAEHPFFNRARDGNSSDEDGQGGPWGWGFPSGPHHRGGWHRGGPWGRGPFGEGPSRPHPPPGHEGQHPPPPPGEKRKEGEDGGDKDMDDPPSYDGPKGPGEPGEPRGPHHHGRRGGRGGCGGRGPRGRRWGPPGPWNMGPLGDFVQSQMFGENGNEDRTEDFKPDVDVFDTESAFVVHASLPGAKKEDIAINWDAEKSELGVTGVTFRPGDEEFLKTLAMDERKVGAFERKVRLGSRAQPAHVDVDAISAKLEEGILVVTVPKMMEKDYVEVKKVDIE